MKLCKITLGAGVVLAASAIAYAAVRTGQEPEMPKPGPEHEALKLEVGTWKGSVKYWMAPDMPMETKGTETIQLSMDGFWLITDVKEEGGTYKAHGFVGYDAEKQKYVGAFVDNMMPRISTIEGTFDKAKKTFHYHAEAPDMMTGKMTKRRTVVTYPDANTRHVDEWAMGADGKEWKTLEIRYTRM